MVWGGCLRRELSVKLDKSGDLGVVAQKVSECLNELSRRINLVEGGSRGV